MPKGSPIQLTLYGPDDEPQGEYSRSIIPWKFLKRAIGLADLLQNGQLGEKDLDALGQLVVDFYGGQFTLADLENGADTADMLTVLQAIVARAGELAPQNAAAQLGPNPTPPG